VCLGLYVVNIQRRFERGNHDADSLDYIVFPIDWIINLPVKYSGIEGVDLQVIDLLWEFTDSITATQCTNSQTTETIFTGGPKFNIPKEELEFLVEQGFRTPDIANLLGVLKVDELLKDSFKNSV